MQFKKTVLPNGVRIITVPMRGNPTVTVSVSVTTGSFCETPEQSGISHFLEHMCFKGTVKRPTPKAISTELDAIGAGYNAFTSREVTGYWAKADTKHFAKIADVCADIYKNSVLPVHEMEKEKGVVIGEIDMYADDPQEKVHDAIRIHMYKGEPAERDVLGTKETVRSFTRDMLLAYRSSQYTGPNTVIVVAGGIPENTMIAWAQNTFFDLSPALAKPEYPTQDKKQTAPETLFIDKDTDQAHLVMSWRTFDRNHPDRYIAKVITNILRGGMSSRLFIKLREEMGSGYYIGAHHTMHKSFGSFSIATGTTSERVPEIVSAILSEIERLKVELVPTEELDKVKEFIRARRIMGLETSDDVAEFVGSQELARGEIYTPEEFERIYASVTREDIMRVAQTLFIREKMTLAVIGKDIHKEAVSKALGA